MHKETGKTLMLFTALGAGMFLLTACAEEDAILPEQEAWIETMEEYYPDDDSTYVKHDRELLDTIDPSTIVVSSEKFPGQNIFIKEDSEGRLISNYPDLLHEDAVDKFYEDKLAEYIECDEISVGYVFNGMWYVEPVSDEEYIEQNAADDYYARFYYAEGHDYPERDELVDDILVYLSDTGAYNGAFNFYRAGSEERDFRFSILLTSDGILRDLSYYEGESYSEDDRDRLVNMQKLEDVLKERGLSTDESAETGDE